MYLLSSNIGEIGLMAGATLLGLPLPLSAVQILSVNLATDGLPALALSVDPPEQDLMKRKPRNPRTGIFTRPVVLLMLVGGIWSTIVNLGMYIWADNSGRSHPEAMTMTFVSLVLIQFFKAYNFRSDRHSVLHKPFANKWLNWAILFDLLFLLVIVYVPAFHEPFGTFALPWQDWAILIPLAFTVVPVLEPVSYTHLDVYKRQVPGDGPGAGSDQSHPGRGGVPQVADRSHRGNRAGCQGGRAGHRLCIDQQLSLIHI